MGVPGIKKMGISINIFAHKYFILNSTKRLKFSLCIVDMHLEGTLS